MDTFNDTRQWYKSVCVCECVREGMKVCMSRKCVCMALRGCTHCKLLVDSVCLFVCVCVCARTKLGQAGLGQATGQ